MATTPPPYNQINNPTKEILASSGIFVRPPESGILAPALFAVDLPNSLIANTGIQKTTTSTTPRPTVGGRVFDNLSSGNFFIDDMLVFNKYIHYDTKQALKTFDPQSFLQESIGGFNIYSREFRT
jgi:hypothetical protein